MMQRVARLSLMMMALASPAVADGMLAGAVKNAGGQPMGGVTVSAKLDGKTITVSVFTDEAGRYVFPALPEGSYAVWAQAVSFTMAKSSVMLGAKTRQDFTLAPFAGDFTPQLSGSDIIAALPGGTPDDLRLKMLVRGNCVGCHTPSFPLQNRFDEAGWTAMLDYMKRVDHFGAYKGDKSESNLNIEFHEKELAAYLARARGPGPTSMTFDHLRPRPSGEAARAVFREYAIPLDRDEAPDNSYALNDGSDWSMGAPKNVGRPAHDAVMDLDGNIWATHDTPTRYTTLTRVDGKTGEVRRIKMNSPTGELAAQSHGIMRDPQGMIWFSVGPTLVPRLASLARLDPRTEKIETFTPSADMAGPASVGVDWDGKGGIWVTTNPGALRFDPATKQFTEFKSPTFKTANGLGNTYGLAADAEGNALWAQMAIDQITKADVPSKELIEVKLAPEPGKDALLSPAEREMYKKFGPDFQTSFPWSQGPRRMGSDKLDNVAWVADSWGGNLARIDTRTLETKLVPLPDPATMQPYAAAADSQHNAWTNLWIADQIARYSPKTGQWTVFDYPTHGTESRLFTLLEKDGKLTVTIAYSRARKVAAMTVRSEQEIAAQLREAGL
jgi:streptogramin lyase